MPNVKTGPLKVQEEDCLSRLTWPRAACSISGFTTALWPSYRPLVATNRHRHKLWRKLMGFLAWPILTRKFSYVFISGGYLSLHETPDDIDIVLQTREPFGPHAFKALEPFFSIGLESIHEVYSVHLHFWMENAPPGMTDFRSFFQYARPG